MKRSVYSRRATYGGVLVTLLALVLVPGAARATTITEYPTNAIATGIAPAPDGGAYVTTSAASILRVSQSGIVTARFKPDPPETGTTITIDLPVFSRGSLWFRITRASAGGTVTTLARRDPDGTTVEFPLQPITSLVADADGNLWFTAPTGFGRIAPNGQTKEFPDPLGTPTSIAVDGEGRLWLTMTGIAGQARVATASPDGRLTPTGVSVSTWKVVASSAATVVWLASDEGLCCYVGQKWLDTVAWLSPGTTGDRISWGFLGTARLSDIAMGPDGNAWVVDQASGGIGRISTSGRTTLFTAGLAAGAVPHLIAPALDDALWFTDDNGRIGRVAVDRPTTTTEPATGVDQSVAGVSAVVTPRGTISRVRFEYGPTTAYGRSTRWQDMGDGDDAITAKARLDGLSAGITYHYRAVLSSAFGLIPGPGRTLTTAPAPPPPPVPPTDGDGDGYAAAVDCDDRASATYPGAHDVPGDGIDQDCSGGDAALTRFFPHVTQYFKSKRGHWSRFTDLTIDDIPSGATVALACSGRGCRFKRWSMTAKRDIDVLALLKHLKGSKLGPQATLELRLTLAEHIGTVVRWKVGPPPKPSVTCLPPGATKDRRC